jgi:predicted CXXCH cytochrome family protein
MTAKSKRLLLVLGVAALVAMLVPGIAFANAGVHGNYAMDTDQCAGCHRAHTAPSSLTWQRSDINPSGGTDTLQRNGLAPGERSALLIGNARNIEEFCYTCHGANAQGADTNVEEGLYENRSLASAGAYGTDQAALISGPFGRVELDIDGNDTGRRLDWNNRVVTSAHPTSDGSWPAWGGGRYSQTATAYPQWEATSGLAGNGETPVAVGCSSCHDVHGTSNYRLLKNQVYGVNVGGYVGSVPTPFVTSVEVNYPPGGFAKGTDYVALGYQPNYTTPNYSRPPNDDPAKGMSGWCVGCHTYYMGQRNISDTQRYTVYGGVEATQHRHPVNVPLSNFNGGGTSVVATTTGGPQLPLAHATRTDGTTTSDWLDCLTCHTAHGTTAVMEGWAATQLNPPGYDTPILSGGAGPSDDSALLRYDNRYVCQACHVK